MFTTRYSLVFTDSSTSSFGAAVTESSATAPITITTNASSVYQSTYNTTYSSSYASPSVVISSTAAAPSSCWWAPEGATSYIQPSASVTLVPTTTWASGVASTVYATIIGAGTTQVAPGRTATATAPAVTQVVPGGTTTAAAIAARNNNGTVTSVTYSAAGTQNATTFYPTIIYGNGTATAFPTAYPTASVNGSVLVCAGANGTATALVPASTAAPINSTTSSNSTDGESLKSTGNENGASMYVGSGIAIAASLLALTQHIIT